MSSMTVATQRATYVATPYLAILVGNAYAELLEDLQAAHRAALHDDREAIVALWADFVHAYSDEISFFARAEVIQTYRPQILNLIDTAKTKSDSVKSLFVQSCED